jgi:exopolysaccharide biosynthesis polyprenyl glycosylphosphotransferase
MKRSEVFFNLAAIPVDIIALAVAAFGSYYIRTRGISRPIVYHLTLRSFAAFSIAALPVVLVIFALFGLYNLKSTRRFFNEFKKIIAAISMCLFAVMAVFFFNESLFQSRFILLLTWLFGIVLVTFARWMLRRIQADLLRRGYGLHKLVIVSGPQADESLINIYENSPELGYKVVSVLSDENNLLENLETLYHNPGQDIADANHNVSFEEILQANPNLDQSKNLALVNFARSKGLNFSFVPNFFDAQRNMIETETVAGLPVIYLKNTPLDGWGKIVKRCFDIAVSALALVIASPLFLVAAIAIKLDSPGKILYAAPRGGHRQDFTFYKFRTMYSHLSVGNEYGGVEAEKIRMELWKMNARGGEDGPFLKIKDDPRVTRVGKFLRKTKLDEIPQFLNVLKGQMSLVGPRAHVIDEVNRYRAQYRRLFSIRPGIFGLSQIAQLSWPDLPFDEEVRLNTFYIENWSLWLDITVLFRSVWEILFGKKQSEDY